MKKIDKLPSGRIRVQTINAEPSLTKQSFRDMVNVNKIMEKYRKSGMITHINSKSGIYGDFTEIPSYSEALQTIIHAQETFMSLPATTRSRFGNDPQQLMDFLNNPSNKEEAIKLNLIKKPEPPNTPENQTTPTKPASDPSPQK